MTSAGTVLWNELFTADPDGAKQFYSRLFGWQSFMPAGLAGAAPETVWMIGFEQVASLRRNAPTGPAPAPAWVPFVTVDDVDGCAGQAEMLGATIVAAPFDVPGSGRFAILKDPQGAIFGVSRPLPLEPA